MLQHKAELKQRFRHGRVLLDLADAVLSCLEPAALVKQAVTLRDNTLTIQGTRFDLKTFDHIYVVGAGKATLAMAQALHQLLGDRITAGHINVPVVKQKRLGAIQVHQASHPFPDASTLAATQQLFKLVEQASSTDLVICLFSGGGSSMLPLPANGLRLSEKIAVTKKLMRASADIFDLNTVRKHLSAIKGGRLAQAAGPASVISLIISDVIGDRLDMIASGPTVPDLSTAADAIDVLQRYRLCTDKLCQIIQLNESPKHLSGKRIHNFVIGSNQVALELAAATAKRAGLRPLILTSCLQGEAKEAARVITAMAHEVEQHNRPVRKPALLLFGGETTVTVLGKGHGGRNQELVLAAVPFLSHQMSILSLATDGVDGITPEPVAGALADGAVADQCVIAGINYHDYLYSNNSFACLRQLGCILRTGPTGTNVGDIVMVLIQ